VPENPELELPALDLPLRQFEDLQVDSNNASELGKEAPGEQPSNVPGDVEMEPDDTLTHPSSTERPDDDGEDSIYDNRPASVPPIDILITTPSAVEEDELVQEDRHIDLEEDTSPPGSYSRIDTDEWARMNDPPPRSYYQQQSEAAMCRTISRLLAHFLPLTTMRLGSRASPRPMNRLREIIPKSQFRQLFREYKGYQDLVERIGSVREDQRKVPNRWQTYLPRFRRIRQLLAQYIDESEALVRDHGYLDGLKEYATESKVEFWLAENPGGGFLYTHELQYLFCLHQFLVDNEYFNLASRTQQVCQSTFEQPSDLWAMVCTIIGRLDPPSYEFELDCNFEPRTDEVALRQRAVFEQRGRFH